MLFLAAFLPLLGSVGAANSFANSTTSKATLTTTSHPGKASRSCKYPLQSAVDSGSVKDGDYEDCNRPGDPEVLGGNYNIYEYEYSGSIASQCSVSFEDSLTSWMATAPITTQSIVYTDEVSGVPYTTQYDVVYDNFFSFAPAEPCCGNCTLYGGDVQIYYWPTPAPTPGVTKLVNEANFTFTSPSIYVAFNSLYATDMCGHVGKDISRTTIAFAPGALSTAMAYQYNGTGPDYLYLGNSFTAASFGSALVCENMTSSFIFNNVDGSTYPYDQPLPSSVQSYCSASPYSCNFDEYSITYNPCSPTVSVPSQLFTLNAQWKGCNQGIDAFFDPPYTLTQGGGLTAFSAAAIATTTPSAQPQVSPNAPTPTPTFTPNPSPSPDPSPSVDPSPSADPSTSPDLSPSDPSPSPNISPNQDQSPNQTPTPSPNATPAQGASPQQPQSQPQATPADPNTPAANPHATTPIPFVIGTQTITPGSPAAVISGTTYSVPSSGGAVVINNSITRAIPQPQATTPIPFVAGTQTITPGSPAVVISGTTYSVPSSGGAVIINNSITQSIPQPQVTTPVPFVVGTQTITPGSPAVIISGTTYSVPSSGGTVIINNSITEPIPQPTQNPGSPKPAYVLGSQTLVAGGPAITISGSIVVNLMSGGQSVVVEESSTTETLALTAAFTLTEGVLATGTSMGLGGVIVSIGGFTTPTSTSAGASGSAGATAISFTGSGSRINLPESFTTWVIGVAVATFGMLVF